MKLYYIIGLLSLTACIPQIKDMQVQIDQNNQRFEDLTKKLSETNKRLNELTKDHQRLTDMLKELPAIMGAQKTAFEQLDNRVKMLESTNTRGKRR